MNKYDAKLNLNEENPLTLLLNNIKNNSIILEFGPATGRMTRHLKENMGCKVYIVELDEECYSKAMNYAENGYLGDIEKFEWLDKFNDIEFDYILFADVLEHLRNPELAVEKSLKLLKDDGMLGISVPNIAHNSIIVNLLNDTFQYNKIGLLDNTHIKFFTYNSAKEMLEKAGMVVCNEMANYIPAMSNEFPYNFNDLSALEKEALLKHTYGSVYQFVFMAVKKSYYETNSDKVIIKKNIIPNRESYSMKIYINTGYGDEDQQSITKESLYENFNVTFDLSDYKKIKSLRCNFFNVNRCIVKIDKITINGEELPSANLEGDYKYSYKNIYIFDSYNPYLYIICYKDSISSFNIQGKIEKIYNFEVLSEYLEENKNIVENYNDIINLNNKIDTENQTLINKYKSAKIANKKLADKNRMLSNQLSQINENVNNICNENNALRNELNVIINSQCWRATKPIRKLLDFIKNLINPDKKKMVNIRENDIQISVSEDIQNGKFIKMSEINPISELNKKIAVHVHLYYIDLMDEYISYLNNIPYKFDLFVSCKEGTNIKAVERKMKKIKKVYFVKAKISINRGRDIAPLYVQFGEEIKNYDYILHIHTKKSLYSGNERYGWRQYSLDNVLGSENVVRNIFSLFESSKNIGIMCPDVYDDVPNIALSWLANAAQGREILQKLNIPYEDGVFWYPVGSFFWAKVDAIKPLFDYKFKYEDFQEEQGQTDGTTAHALERVIGFVAKSRGYKIAFNNNQKVVLEKTKKPFKSYFSLDTDSVKEYLSRYEIISFDIFDTLITRYIFNPDDIFNIMKMKIKKIYDIDVDFLQCRKKAEGLAWSKKGEYCSIDDIYEELGSVMNISREMCLELKQMEINVELTMCIPRKDVLDIFNYLQTIGKKIILISDMYLKSDTIREMLSRCGYKNYDELWISCEIGARKDNGSMWKKFFEKYDKYRTIHVGDNMRSDIQILLDQKKDSFLVLNPRDMFKLSKNYFKFEKYLNSTVENSLLMGTFVNAGICNSAFSQKSDTGEVFIQSDFELGFIAFGPIFATFTKWIDEQCDKDNILLFLAREGYLLEKLYREFNEVMGGKLCKFEYFLTSRRSATVAGISTKDDIRDIISQYYKGSLSNLLKNRLGIEIDEFIEDFEVSMPEDEQKIMDFLDDYMQEIFDKVKKERRLYLQYVQEVLEKHNGKDISVIDVGYAGTIQYYLAKLLNKKIDGYYLCTSINKKPEKIGCICNAIYELNTEEDVKNSKIFKAQLFLEAALQAPYGQFICFDENNKKRVPIYKDDNIVPEEIKNVQKGILEYTKVYFNIIKDIYDCIDISSELVEDIFYTIVFENDFSENISNAFNVQDDYCSNGNHKFDTKNKKWSIS